jgi:hypothetical protein
MAKPRLTRDRDLPADAIEEPSWVIPAVVLAIVGVLSLGFLAYYFAPNLGDIIGRSPKPSEGSAEINVIIGGVPHRIPENYTRFAYARRGGAQDRVELYALLPDLSPYNPGRAAAFQDNSPDSRVLLFDLEYYHAKLSETDQFRKVFLKLVIDPDGARGPYGLRRYDFDPSSGYRDEEMFVSENEDGTVVVFRCFKAAPDILSPTCRRDLRLSNEIGLTYRFKRSYLGDWRDIDSHVRTLALSFRVAQQPQ